MEIQRDDDAIVEFGNRQQWIRRRCEGPVTGRGIVLGNVDSVCRIVSLTDRPSQQSERGGKELHGSDAKGEACTSSKSSLS